MNFRFAFRNGGHESRPDAVLAVLIAGVFMALSLTGCQDEDGGSNGGGAVRELKQLYPPVTEVVRDGQPEDAYFSYDSASGIYYRAVPGFVWHGALADADGSFADPAGYEYSGFAMQVETNETSPSLEQICSSAVVVSLYPPAATATTSGVVFDSTAGMSNSSVVLGDGQCGNEYFRLRALDDDGNGEWDRLQYSFPPGENSEALLTTAAPGGWQLRNGASLLANFELPPLTAEENGHPRVVIPVPRINRDPGGSVESIDIHWWRYDSAIGSYRPVNGDEEIHRTRVALLDSAVGGSGEIREEYSAYGLADRAIFPRYPWWAFGGGSAPEGVVALTAIQISYEIDGVAYRFVWQSS